VTPEIFGDAFTRLDDTLQAVADDFYDEFAPAIDRIWRDGLEATRADLRQWLRKVSEERDFRPWRFELAFGLKEDKGKHDPASVLRPVELDVGVQVRGSIDLVEKSVRGTLRATDYKTGKARAHANNVVGGGRHLQPLLYALVLEKLLPELPVESGRLYYCTQAGGFSDVKTNLNDPSRRALGEVVETIGKSLREGFLPAAPDKGECRFCDYRPVCGPDEERRLERKSKAELSSLKAIRELP
jgi:CRISPR/Cas system-associated exonuclease Cas4 (RecB family)